MKEIKISQLEKEIGKQVSIKGWVETIRDQGKIAFIILRRQGVRVQIVIDKIAALEQLKHVTVESVVKVSGVIVKQKSVKTGIEFLASDIAVLSKAQQLPVSLADIKSGQVSQRVRLDNRWIDLRDEKKQLIFKVWTIMEQAFINYVVSRGFVQIHTPNIMAHASETGSELFEIEYFGKKAYLAQSAQAYKQMTIAAGFEKVFHIGPVFRANKSLTTRHDTEFTQYDIEIGFVDSHEDIIKEEEAFIIAIMQAVKKSYGHEIGTAFNVKLDIPTKPFPKITFYEAKKLLKVHRLESKPGDFSPEEEKKLGEIIKDKYNHDFVFITDWPVEERAFYHMRYKDNAKLTKGFDLLYKGLEITTGSQREHRYEQLLAQIKEYGYDPKGLQEYLQFFKYGCPPHGGLGFGPSRFLMQMFELPNVREVTFLYRGVKRLKP